MNRRTQKPACLDLLTAGIKGELRPPLRFKVRKYSNFFWDLDPAQFSPGQRDTISNYKRRFGIRTARVHAHTRTRVHTYTGVHTHGHAHERAHPQCPGKGDC